MRTLTIILTLLSIGLIGCDDSNTAPMDTPDLEELEDRGPYSIVAVYADGPYRLELGSDGIYVSTRLDGEGTVEVRGTSLSGPFRTLLAGDVWHESSGDTCTDLGCVDGGPGADSLADPDGVFGAGARTWGLVQ